MFDNATNRRINMNDLLATAFLQVWLSKPQSEINNQQSKFRTEGLSLSLDTVVSFVPMVDLGGNRINFAPKDTKTIGELGPSYTNYTDGDVLLAKVTPCFENTIAGVAKGLTNGMGFGSSEFYVLRPSDRVLADYIYPCVTSRSFREPVITQMTGTGGLQRVPRAYVEQSQIPLPPLDVQKEIMAENEGHQTKIEHLKQGIAEEEKKIQTAITRDWGESQ